MPAISTSVEMLWIIHNHKAFCVSLAAAVGFWVDPVTLSPSPDRPKLGLPLGAVTPISRHGVQGVSSCETAVP
jgi:hypothetical protein